ncbi:putative TIM-barrel fold metal-dependent hydrolase [Variovorax beijingensis]|jgi:predicted TIM-barrel fold metal-dependent hydrolase|uniref:Putative TIM-barrel fold metal-dependent hydrolase n=1 Tax=Variovorax beijingensis TaxID=2496117 RepID=A0A561B3X8_9BURK|nr:MULTISPECIES: amidohydrolase family protein [Variovorax]MDR6456194.1 putative TIM-barrel fold metal-dependent hydrolase [Variovorax paradoxus]TWD73544.1 putative TIM-barrel fold metal-dependent hydrolase [Variovorax beijingensis]
MNGAPHAPAGWDCHAHLFGPYDRFPLASERSYTPPEAVALQYLALLARLGLGHGVLVHPSAYGEDHALLLHALAAHANLRGVVVVQPGSRLALNGLHGKGVRGARFSHRSGAGSNFAGSASFDDLRALAPALADAGLHAELWTDGQALPGIAAELKALPVPVVIDHMGGFDVEAGVDAPGFRVLLELLASGRTWVKLCAYRNLLNAPDWQAGRAFQQKLVEANPERLVWGSDWPHLRVAPAPDTAALLAMFKDWAGNDDVVRQVLQDNPAVLYR